MFNKKPQSWIDLESTKPARFNALLLAAGLLLSLLVAVTTLYQPAALQRVKALVYDIQLEQLESAPPSSVPLIVDVDERSLAQFGQWPWPRYRIALLLAKLQLWGASVVALDMVFPEVDRTSPSSLKRVLERDFDTTLSLDGIPESLQDNDQILANTLKQGSVILGNVFHFQPETKQTICYPSSTSIVLRSQADRSKLNSRLLDASDAVCNIPQLSKAATGAGFFNAWPDIDGVFRKIPLLVTYQGRTYPSLALEATLKAMDINQLMVDQHDDGFSLNLPNKKIELDRSGNLHLRFRGPSHTFPYVSAAAILNDEVAPQTFHQRTVFVGSSAAGINDSHATPTDPAMPGIELHAVVADNLLQTDYFQLPGWGLLAEATTSIGMGMLLSAAMIWASPFVGLSILLGGILGLAIGSQALLENAGLILSPIPAILAMLLISISLSALNYWREQTQHQNRLRQYQDSQEATIEGFGTLAEYRDPETGGHVKRTQAFIRLLAAQLASHDKFKDQINDAVIDILGKAAPLHDIGKVGVRDNILLKPSSLSVDEFEEMKKHTVYGADIIQTVINRVGNTPFLIRAQQIAHYHQEKWDGSGYPEGLSGTDIPLPARLMAVADVYDALTCERSYKAAHSHIQAKTIIIEGRGQHFDPDIVDAFLAVEQAFISTALANADSPSHQETLLRTTDR
ncbi:MAG: CHASE2 domain-containing protein [Halopseudomonas sp.]